MKQLIAMMLALSIGVAAEAQPKIRGNVGGIGRPRVIVTAPVYPIYPPTYGYGMGSRFGFGYSPFYSPFNEPYYRGRTNSYNQVPEELQLELDDINNDFDYRISEVRREKSASGKERREQIRDLKHQKENAVIDAKKAFYKYQRSKSNRDSE